jgi:Mn-containing catalase
MNLLLLLSPYFHLIKGVGIKEISHVELISKTIAQLLERSPKYHGKKFDTPGKGCDATMEMAKEQQNAHHYIVGA